MRVLLISDTHGRLEAVKKLDRLFQSFGPDQIVFLGDALNNGPRNGVPIDYDPMACAQILNKWSRKIVAVRGNCDSRVDQTLLHFDISEDSKVIYINGFRCDLIHGDLLSSDLLEVERGDILMFGHTHVPMLKKMDGVDSAAVSFLTTKLVIETAEEPSEDMMKKLKKIVKKVDSDITVKES